MPRIHYKKFPGLEILKEKKVKERSEGISAYNALK